MIYMCDELLRDDLLADFMVVRDKGEGITVVADSLYRAQSVRCDDGVNLTIYQVRVVFDMFQRHDVSTADGRCH